IPNRRGTLRIEADNSPDPDLIPSDMSDFFLYGGITRNVWLYRTNDTYIETMICNVDTNPESAIVTIDAHIVGEISGEKQLNISITPMQRETEYLSIQISEFSNHFTVELPPITGDELHFWSPENPVR